MEECLGAMGAIGSDALACPFLWESSLLKYIIRPALNKMKISLRQKIKRRNSSGHIKNKEGARRPRPQ
jgi:hypothetical protein